MHEQLPDPTSDNTPSINPDAITQALIVTGWTKHPDDIWYPSVALDLEDRFHTPTVITNVPNPDIPSKAKWRDTIAETATDPKHTLFIAHSFGGTSALEWAADQVAHDPSFTMGGFLGVAVNITDAGFPELTDHFSSSLEVYADQGRLLQPHIRHQPAFMCGLYDEWSEPWQSVELAKSVDGDVYAYEGEAHFSGSFYESAKQRDVFPMEDRRQQWARMEKIIHDWEREKGLPLSRFVDEYDEKYGGTIPRHHRTGQSITQHAARIILCSRSPELPVFD